DGTIHGATWTTGKNGGGLSFDGINDYVSVPRMNHEEISIVAWFYKHANDATNYDTVFSAFKNAANEQNREGYELGFNPVTWWKLSFTLVTKSEKGIRKHLTAEYNLSPTTGRWYHAVGTYNKTTGEQKLYLNGELVDSQTHPAGNTIVPLTLYSDMRIGHSRVNNGYFKGMIDGVRLYNRALSDEEVQDIYNNQ
ncbi:MAG: hypothetical protein CV087_06635, partial [Candidatus Brocadia sp. WS118]